VRGLGATEQLLSSARNQSLDGRGGIQPNWNQSTMNDHNALTEFQRDKLLKEVHRSLVGDPLDPQKPGVVAIVGRHHMALYGKDEQNGLVGDNARYKKLFWVGTGIFLTVQGAAASLFAWWISTKTAH
jgi:hypothetical protein